MLGEKSVVDDDRIALISRGAVKILPSFKTGGTESGSGTIMALLSTTTAHNKIKCFYIFPSTGLSC